MQKEVQSDQTGNAGGFETIGVAQAARAINNGDFTAEAYSGALLERARE